MGDEGPTVGRNLVDPNTSTHPCLTYCEGD